MIADAEKRFGGRVFRVGDKVTQIRNNYEKGKNGVFNGTVGVVEVTEARVVAASDIDEQFARDEGEGFESVEDWRVAHEHFFERPIEPETPIEAVRFRLVEDD